MLLLPLVSVVHRGIMHAAAAVLEADACCCSCCIFCHSVLFQLHCVTPFAHGCHGTLLQTDNFAAADCCSWVSATVWLLLLVAIASPG